MQLALGQPQQPPDNCMARQASSARAQGPGIHSQHQLTHTEPPVKTLLGQGGESHPEPHPFRGTAQDSHTGHRGSMGPSPEVDDGSAGCADAGEQGAPGFIPHVAPGWSFPICCPQGHLLPSATTWQRGDRPRQATHDVPIAIGAYTRPVRATQTEPGTAHLHTARPGHCPSAYAPSLPPRQTRGLSIHT